MLHVAQEESLQAVQLKPVGHCVSDKTIRERKKSKRESLMRLRCEIIIISGGIFKFLKTLPSPVKWNSCCEKVVCMETHPWMSLARN